MKVKVFKEHNTERHYSLRDNGNLVRIQVTDYGYTPLHGPEVLIKTNVSEEEFEVLVEAAEKAYVDEVGEFCDREEILKLIQPRFIPLPQSITDFHAAEEEAMRMNSLFPSSHFSSERFKKLLEQALERKKEQK